jgi:hypothetical protein
LSVDHLDNASGHTAEELEGQILLGAIIVIFIEAYAAIALEHPTKINKGASALLGQIAVDRVRCPVFTVFREKVNGQTCPLLSATNETRTRSPNRTAKAARIVNKPRWCV